MIICCFDFFWCFLVSVATKNLKICINILCSISEHNLLQNFEDFNIQRKEISLPEYLVFFFLGGLHIIFKFYDNKDIILV